MASAQASDELPVKESYKNIADLLKIGYSYQEDVAVEGLFEDIIDHKSFLVGLTSRHLVFANVDFVPTFEISELTSLLPLKWLTITVADARLKILRVVYCTEKNYQFRFCDAEGDPEAVWLAFVSLINAMNLDKGVIWEKPDWEVVNKIVESDTGAPSSDASSEESLPMFKSYLTSPRSRGDTLELVVGKCSAENPTDITKDPEITPGGGDEQDKSGGDNALNLKTEPSFKIVSMNDLFEKVHEHHFGSLGNPQKDELGQMEMPKTIFNRKTDILENSLSLNQKLNTDPDQWSISSEEEGEEGKVIFANEERDSSQQPPRKSRRQSMKNFFTPSRSRREKSTSDEQQLRWWMCCISKVEYDE